MKAPNYPPPFQYIVDEDVRGSLSSIYLINYMRHNNNYKDALAAYSKKFGADSSAMIVSLMFSLATDYGWDLDVLEHNIKKTYGNTYGCEDDWLY